MIRLAKGGKVLEHFLRICLRRWTFRGDARRAQSHPRIPPLTLLFFGDTLSTKRATAGSALQALRIIRLTEVMSRWRILHGIPLRTEGRFTNKLKWYPQRSSSEGCGDCRGVSIEVLSRTAIPFLWAGTQRSRAGCPTAAAASWRIMRRAKGRHSLCSSWPFGRTARGRNDSKAMRSFS